MKKEYKIQDLNLVGTRQAMEILESKHKSGFRGMIKSYEIPHVKLSSGKVFLREDIEIVKNSQRRTRNLMRRHGKDPRKIREVPQTIEFSQIQIGNLGLVSAREARSILEIKSRTHFDKLLVDYSIDFAEVDERQVFLRSDVEKIQNSDRRQENLKYRRKD